ncbi:MAG: hypothetical protein IJO31_06545 [Oscillospiraceae bacterium]|nr:hypothetical protein [Oscillospiraceae bacterium]
MAKHIMDVRASDNKYLHRDFHMSGDCGLRYVGENYGDNGVKEYLRTFATAYYKPLIEDFKARGLVALMEQQQKLYETEEMPEAFHAELSDNDLVVTVDRCPAITYFRKQDYAPSPWYIELTRTVNETIADLCDLGFSLISYDEQTGAAKYRYFRRSF